MVSVCMYGGFMYVCMHWVRRLDKNVLRIICEKNLGENLIP